MDIYMERCSLCDTDFENVRKLSCHLRHHHQMKLEDYWLLHNERTYCVQCGRNTEFFSWEKGYNLCCSSRVCTCTHSRMKLNLDQEKNDSFKKKVSENQKRIWATRDNIEIRKKIGNTIRVQRSLMSPLERKQKHGQSPGHYQSLKRFWETASDEVKEEIYERRFRNWTPKNCDNLDENEVNLWYQLNHEFVYQNIQRSFNG